MLRKSMASIITILSICLLVGGAIAQSDPFGAADTVTLMVEETGKGKWTISANLFNDEELAAVDIPVKFTAGIAKVGLDSLTYAGGRIDFFAYKFDPKDSLTQIIRFGGLAYMNPNKPALKAGSGEIGRAYVSVRGDKEPGPFAADTVTAPPNATLMLVDKNAKNIIPVLKIVTQKAGKDVKKDEGKKKE